MNAKEKRLADLARWDQVVPSAVMAGSRAQGENVLTDAIADIQVLRSALASTTFMLHQREAEAMDAAVQEVRTMKRWREMTAEASAFVDFVMRHTWPERATKHGVQTVYDLIACHPFRKRHDKAAHVSATVTPSLSTDTDRKAD